MLEKIRRIDIKRAGIASIMIGIVGVFIHMMVIYQIMPFQWVNGGRSTSFEIAQQISKSSIIIIAFNILIALIAAKILPIRFNKFFSIVLTIFLIGTLPLTLVGVVQQFLGTTFEKCFMSIITLIGFFADFRIAIERRW